MLREAARPIAYMEATATTTPESTSHKHGSEEVTVGSTAYGFSFGCEYTPATM
jgi:hypothetical protein